MVWPALLALVLAAWALASLLSSPGSTSSVSRRSAAERVLASMTLPQRVGQLFMVGTPSGSPSPATRAAIRRFHVGNVVLMDTTTGGRRTVRRTVVAMRREVGAASTHRVRPLVAVDQEGGNVQHLRGPGFSTMPTALTQGAWPVRRLQRSAAAWGRELHAAGVNVDLAPVSDTVPASVGGANEPIGHWQRELGYAVPRVSSHATAVVRGMREAGVATSAKHFPGLGRVRGNTDFSSSVVDGTTRRDDAYLRPFRATVDAGVPMVMMSTAWYSRIDRHNPACFSAKVIRGMLRHDLGFDGVVVSDSLDTPAVARWSPAQRALKFLRAGGDVILVSTADPVPAMYHAVLAGARSDPALRSLVDRSALRVLRVKQAEGLL